MLTSTRGSTHSWTGANLHKRHLNDARQQLILLAQRLYFGTVHELQIRAGDPVFDPPPKVIRRVKLGGHNTARPQAAAADFALKQEWVEFFDYCDACENGTVLVIEVAHGLPLFFEIEQPVSI